MFGMMGANAQKEIGSIRTSGAPAQIIGFAANTNHDTMDSGDAAGKSVGLWVDGPCAPYVGGDGNTYVIIPHAENYRMQLAANWESSGASWSGATLVYDSARQTLEANYNNRNWIFGCHAIGNTIYALAHMEWYQTTMSGSDSQWGTRGGWNGYSLTNRRWVTSPVWMKSTDNGATWSVNATAADRPVLKPEPWSTQSRDTLYGFRHPSNIVEEDGYYYCFLDAVYLPGGTDLADAGFVMVRTNDLESSTTWQYWTGSAWQTVNRATYQGNQSTQVPYLFFEYTGWDPYTVSPRTNRMAQSIRYHVPTQQWLLFGFEGIGANTFCYCRSKTLANPRFEQNGFTDITLGSGDAAGNYIGNHYISVIDPDTATDQNFTEMGNNPVCITADSYERYMQNTLTINVV